jgi:hypothetical protein
MKSTLWQSSAEKAIENARKIAARKAFADLQVIGLYVGYKDIEDYRERRDQRKPKTKTVSLAAVEAAEVAKIRNSRII